MELTLEDAKNNLKTVISDKAMMEALDHALIRYLHGNHAFLETISVTAKVHKVKRTELEKLFRECVPKKFIDYRAMQKRRGFSVK